MEVAKLRKLVFDYQKQGLFVKQRCFYKKHLGKDSANELMQEYNNLLETKQILRPLSTSLYEENKKAYIQADTMLKRNNQLVVISSILEKESLVNLFKNIKKLNKIPTKKSFNYLNDIPTKEFLIKKTIPDDLIAISNSFDEKVPDYTVALLDKCDNYKIMEENKTIGIFSILEDNKLDELAVGNFVIEKSSRKSMKIKDVILNISNFLTMNTNKTISCEVEMRKPFLIRLYEKFGFDLREIVLDKQDAVGEISCLIMSKRK